MAQSDAPEENVVEADDSTPKGAIRAFYTALAKGDDRAASRFLVSADELAEWTRIQAQTSIAFRKLGTASVKRFGEEGKRLQMQAMAPAELILQKLDTWKLEENGDEAVWHVNPNAPLKMKKIDGRWKLDVLASFQSPEHLELLNDVMARVNALVGKVADDLEQGRFDSVAEVRVELKRQREAMERELADPAPSRKP
ncbi:MAG: hypothetical protein WD066_05020 [Planctomycetaceae bacterium]